MESAREADVTRLLQDWSNGDSQALPRLLEIVYPELHQIAARYVSRERHGHTLQPTALVNETYLRLAQHAPGKVWTDRTHFFAVSARIVRAVLVDHARARHAVKRGAGAERVELEGHALATAPAPLVDLLDLDAALTALERLDAQQSRIVELRHFAGLSVEETAVVLNVSASTVKRDWVAAKTWIRRHMSGSVAGP
jgi:RNA polymerase sigma factor (TIGR02999 family)